MDSGRELTEAETQVRRAGLRLLARIIASQLLAERAAAREQANEMSGAGREHELNHAPALPTED